MNADERSSRSGQTPQAIASHRMRRRTLLPSRPGPQLIVPAMLLMLTALEARGDDPELTHAPDATKPSVRLVVGKNFRVSAARPNIVHQGCTIAADSKIPPRLFAASMTTPKSGIVGIAGYYSHDGGETWALGVERTGPTRPTGCSDEAVAFGADGELFLAYMRTREVKGDLVINDTELLRSGDGGKSWVEGAVIKGGFVDRPQLVADLTSGPFRGRLYCSANVLVDGQNTAAVFASADNGTTMRLGSSPSPAGPTVYNSNPVVLADGTVVVAYHKIGGSASQAARIPVWRSTDGGGTFKLVSPVRTAWRHSKAQAHASSGVTMYPRLAGESANSAGPGRLYCTWQDGDFVLFSWSADRGDTWSKPILLSEQPLTGATNGTYDAYYPAIAVNKDGQIAVLWYDRRGLRRPVAGGGKYDGYNLRLRASMDGGLTWLPSIQVNEAPGKGDVGQVRGWVGMAASADDRFHPAWISDSSATLQVWTATVGLNDLK
jgi:hypothetical protein